MQGAKKEIELSVYRKGEGKQENPAKTFLKRYRAMLQRRESIQRAIDEAYDRATQCTQKIRAVPAAGGAGDKVADAVIKIADGTEQLKGVLRQIDADLGEILRAIESVPDEMQKTVLTLRYIEGLGWDAIQERLHFEKTYTLIVHGRALKHIRQWMQEKGIEDYKV